MVIDDVTPGRLRTKKNGWLILITEEIQPDVKECKKSSLCEIYGAIPCLGFWQTTR